MDSRLSASDQSPFFNYARVAEGVTDIRQTGDAKILVDYKPVHSTEFNELLIFLKPELTTKYPDDDRTYTLCERKFRDFSCTCVAVAILGPEYLKRRRLIEAHYGLINAYSVNGLEALPQDGRARADEVLHENGLEGARVLGAHQVLNHYRSVRPDDLLSWHDSAPETYRLASGAYAFPHEVEGEQLLIIDGFYPSQLAHFYGTRDPLVVFVARSDVSWETLRTRMCGATNPARAVEGSIRRILLERRCELDLEQFDAMRNGIHVSAGPIEAGVEIARYFAVGNELSFGNTSFGGVVENELGEDLASALAANAQLRFWEEVGRAFDVTEHVDAREAIGLVRGVEPVTPAP